MCCLLFGTTAFAARDVQRPEKVFRYDARLTGAEIIVTWDIEDGYYLYRDKMGYAVAGAELGQPVYPTGEMHSDEFFGDQVIFRGTFDVRIPVVSLPAGSAPLTLEIRSQGCADYGLCYPPQKWSAEINRQNATVPVGGGLSALLKRGATPVPNEPLPQEQAFLASVTTPDAFTVAVRWDIEPGYYLYRDSFEFVNPGNEVQLGVARFPEGQMEMDVEFGETEVYYDAVEILIPLSRGNPEPQVIELQVGYQGCKKDGICYPPATITLPVDLPLATRADSIDLPAPVSEQDRLSGIIAEASLPTIMTVFLGLGLLLAFTPCCLPMVPILSGIIAGQGDNVTTGKAFWLSVSYVLGMAFTYTIAGAIFGAAGGQIQAALQTPAIIGGVAILFVALSLAMFGVYELQVPASIQTRLSAIGNQSKTGSFIGTAVMGAVSALVVSTCVAPPLVAALAVIAQTGDVARGAFALFALSIGMGIPLIAFGTSAGKLLPRAGAWMNTVKGVFGFMLLALAIWMLDRILPSAVVMLLWSLLALFAGLWAGALTRLAKPAGGPELAGKGIGLVLVAYSMALFVGALSGSDNVLQPLDRLAGGESAAEAELPFIRIKTVADFEAARSEAVAAGRTLMLDFYADWCVSCKEMEAWTFTDERVHAALAETTLLQADVTANDAADQALLEHFGIFGPPTIVFFDSEGKEVTGQRVIGYMPTDEFLERVGYVVR